MNKTKYKSVEEVPVWQKAHEFTLLVYRLTENFPRQEIYGITAQLRRSAASVAANIAEGFSRHTTKELIKFLYNARGSCAETLYHLRLSKDLGYLQNKDFLRLKLGFDEVGKQLNGWITSLRKKLNH